MYISAQQVINAAQSEDGSKYPIESKVWTQFAGTASGGTLSALILWIIGVTVYHVPNTAEQATNAIAAVPLPISGPIGVALTLGLGLLGGYMAKHNARLNEILQQALAQATQSQIEQSNYIKVDPDAPEVVSEPTPEELEPVTPEAPTDEQEFNESDVTDPDTVLVAGDQVQDNDGESTPDFLPEANPDDNAVKAGPQEG